MSQREIHIHRRVESLVKTCHVDGTSSAVKLFTGLVGAQLHYIFMLGIDHLLHLGTLGVE